jgi:hypothetical protein
MHVVQKAGRIGSNTTQTPWATGGAEASEKQNVPDLPLIDADAP